MKKRGIIIIISITILTCIIWKMENTQNKELLLTAFKNLDIQKVQVHIHSWGKLPDEVQNLQGLEERVHNIQLQYESTGNWIKSEKNEDTKKQYTATQRKKESKTTITVQTIKYKEKKNTYVMLDVLLVKNTEQMNSVLEKVQKIMKKQGVKPTINIMITGEEKGRSTIQKMQEQKQQILSILKAKEVETFENNQINSTYGYAKCLGEYLRVIKGRVNINLAFRYSECEDKTYVYLATPIITVEY